jgi:transketolase
MDRETAIDKSVKLSASIREDCLIATHRSGSSHIASALSISDILAVLYAGVMNYDSGNPKKEDRDILILSKGHSGVALYSVLAETGFFDKELLKDYCAYGSIFSGHVSSEVPGVEFSTGSLGHGAGIAAGIAMAKKMDGRRERVFVICGDGELNEGSVWEAVMFSNRFGLSNLVIIVDRNSMQALGGDILDLNDLESKFGSFGMNVISVDGHNHGQLYDALSENNSESPTVIIANTVKGKGVSFMENNILWHYRNPGSEDLEKALKEVRGEK